LQSLCACRLQVHQGICVRRHAGLRRKLHAGHVPHALPCTALSCPSHLLPDCPAGLPPNDPDFYCNTTRNACFSKGATTVIFPDARTACRTAGGDLVAYTSYEKQLEIQKTLAPASHWIGIERVGATAPAAAAAAAVQQAGSMRHRPANSAAPVCARAKGPAWGHTHAATAAQATGTRAPRTSWVHRPMLVSWHTGLAPQTRGQWQRRLGPLPAACAPRPVAT
jgi:hypothetical protein